MFENNIIFWGHVPSSFWNEEDNKRAHLQNWQHLLIVLSNKKNGGSVTMTIETSTNTYHPDTKSNPNPNPKPNPTTIQHTIVNIN